MAKIDENTVSAKDQLKASEFVTFEYPEGDGLSMMFVGNSITRHAPKAEIGWEHDWGMAASAKEKDYVHLVIDGVRKTHPDASFCICQLADWERKYREPVRDLALFAAAREFKADIIVMRLIENCDYEESDKETFITAYCELMDYLNPDGKAKILLTTGFWNHRGDEAIRECAARNGLPLVELGDLGERDDMKALGLFWHHGVSVHPGDLGMEHIAKRILDGIKDWI